MDFVIVFFRDVLDGPLYIAVSVVCSILICSCIGYMGERYLEEKKQGEEFASKHVSADDQAMTTEDVKKALQTSLTMENGEIQKVAGPAAQQEASPAPVEDAAEQSPEGQLEEEAVEENANVVYAIGGAQVEELLEDD